MFGKPQDKIGECNAHLLLGDDFGDNTCTVRCQLPRGHDGAHREVGRNGSVRIEWDVDERCWTFIVPIWDEADKPPEDFFARCENCYLMSSEHGDPETRCLVEESDA